LIKLKCQKAVAAMQRLFCVLEKVSKGKVSESKGEGNYQLVGWVERSETQQVSELIGESYEERVSSSRRRFNAEKMVILDISG